MKKNLIPTAALAIGLAIPGGLLAVQAHAAAANSAAAAVQDHDDQNRDWQRAPDQYNDAQRRGFHDGIEAARRDAESHRRKDADDHRMFKHPPVDRENRDRYREGFRRGYEAGMQHMMGSRDGQNREEHPRDNQPRRFQSRPSPASRHWGTGP